MRQRPPLTRYDIIRLRMADRSLARIDQDGSITRMSRLPQPLTLEGLRAMMASYPGLDLRAARPGEYADRLMLRPQVDDAATKAAFAQGDNTHVDPRDGRAARRHMLGYWDSKG